MQRTPALESLSHARAIADYAERLGVSEAPPVPRQSYSHIGAVLADAALQAGLNYRTVVRPRIDRIQSLYPRAATLPELISVVHQVGAETFLNWSHVTKVDRFLCLVGVLHSDRVQKVEDLRVWLCARDARDRMLNLRGIGPKTFDYICCLAGMDHVAVDRHIKSFASEAGVCVDGYLDLQTAVSFAADLLGLARRDFDAWIWQRLAARTEIQGALAFA